MIKDGWLDWADTSVRGDLEKRYPEANEGLGIVWHSMEGWKTYSFQMIEEHATKSWMFSITLDGKLWQHYPVWASTWTSGNSYINRRGWSVELEGTNDMPINALQLVTALALIHEWEQYTGKRADRQGNGTNMRGTLQGNMWEHREVDTFISVNAGETACPSERYKPLWETLKNREKDEDMSVKIAEQLENLNKYMRYRLALQNLATAVDQEGEQRMIKAVQLLVDKGLLRV